MDGLVKMTSFRRTTDHYATKVVLTKKRLGRFYVEIRSRRRRHDVTATKIGSNFGPPSKNHPDPTMLNYFDFHFIAAILVATSYIPYYLTYRRCAYIKAN